MTDLVGLNKVKIEYYTTYEIIVDYMPKLLVSGKFKLFHDLIINLSGKNHCIGHQECAG